MELKPENAKKFKNVREKWIKIAESNKKEKKSVFALKLDGLGI